MARLDLDGSAPGYLAEAAQAWLPTDIAETRARILELLVQATAAEVDPVSQLQQAMSRCFPGDLAVVLPAWQSSNDQVQGSALTLESLPVLQRPLLWPQRPKRRSDELFSSWLWRVAVAAAAPPADFVRDVLGTVHDDVDRDIAPDAIRRLAQVSGQGAGHLAAGALSAGSDAAQDTTAGMAEDMMLRHGRLLLARPGPAPRGRARPILQYCPGCLGSDPRPHFLRGWRFASAVACLDHRIRLHDRCWHCGAPVELLCQRVATGQPRCPGCGAVLAQAPMIAAGPAVVRQRNLDAMLCYLAARVPAAQRSPHLDRLAHTLRAPTASVAIRHAAVADMQPATVWAWFGTPEDRYHGPPLQMLARSGRLRDHVTAKARRPPSYQAAWNGPAGWGGRS